MGSPNGSKTKQRLVVCLDGTWNNRDDSTNVFHHFALALKDAPPGGDGATQTKYYHEGVGTGVLDRVIGGGFGAGLEENVRAAYDWLVENYHEGATPEEADEIFIFGFSRGAFTARSLVGFIAACGLLRRGAPLSVNELWEDACIIGREREYRPTVWDYLFGEPPKSIRRITELVSDPWNIAQPAAKPGAVVPGQIAEKLSPQERLLVRWSRRVRITYLGIYETVGAMGIDALAIPGFRSKLASHHHVRPTTIIEHCRHALAVDEHRSSFIHMPLVQYLPHGGSSSESERLNLAATGVSKEEPGVVAREAQPEERAETLQWQDKIEQRWFIGAHSNIGGGYPQNELALRPLHWLLEGAQEAKLISEPLPDEPPLIEPPLPRDSFAEFAKPFWTHVIRGKRFYRTIDPQPTRRARPKKKEGDRKHPPKSYSLRSINEQVDQTVLNCVRQIDEYRPPNVIEYARRKAQETPPPPNVEALQEIARKDLRHPWLETDKTAYLILVLWASAAGAGVAALHCLFTAHCWAPLWLIAATAFIFAMVDCAESRANYALALGPTNPRRRAFLDSVYWLRSLGFLLFVCGVLALGGQLWAVGWNANGWRAQFTEGMQFARTWWLVPVAAAAGLVLINAYDRGSWARQRAGLLGALLGVVSALAIVFAVILFGWACAEVLAPAFGHSRISLGKPARHAHIAGLLLPLEISLIYFVNSFSWANGPMLHAGLGSVGRLQLCCTPAQVIRRLHTWCHLLGPAEDERGAATQGDHAVRAVSAIGREALWRDIFGFIPVYFAVLCYGLWFGSHAFGWHWPRRTFLHVPFWALVPLIAALADYSEDFCHLRYFVLYRSGKKFPAALTIVATVSTIVKYLALLIASSGTAIALGAGLIAIAHLGEKTGWRGTINLLFPAGGVVLLGLAIIVQWRRYLARRKIEAIAKT